MSLLFKQILCVRKSVSRCQSILDIVRYWHTLMILSFKNKGLQRFAERGDASRLSVVNQDRIRRILQRLDLAMISDDVNAPGLFLHALGGDQRGRYSVRVTGNWRITFAFQDNDVIDVDLEDYH
jgi:toxin HigB-1